jgi:hypothetical protein
LFANLAEKHGFISFALLLGNSNTLLGKGFFWLKVGLLRQA